MFENLLARIGKGLSESNIPYIIIGGQAVLLYGEPRLTRDIDITLGMSVDGLDGILTVSGKLGLEPVPDDITEFVKKTMVLPTLDASTGIRVDFIFSFTPYETHAIERARTITIAGQDVRFSSPEDLIIHKIFAGRPRDLEDVRSVVLKNPDIDVTYIRKWLKEFDKSIEGKNFLVIFDGILNR